MTKVTEADIDALKAKNGLKTVHVVTFNKADDMERARAFSLI